MITKEDNYRILAADLGSRWNAETKRFKTLISGIEEFRGDIFIHGAESSLDDLIKEIRKYGYDVKTYMPQWNTAFITQERYDRNGIRREYQVEIFFNPKYPEDLFKQEGWNGLLKNGWAMIQWNGCPYCFAGIRDKHIAPNEFYRVKLIL